MVDGDLEREHNDSLREGELGEDTGKDTQSIVPRKRAAEENVDPRSNCRTRGVCVDY